MVQFTLRFFGQFQISVDETPITDFHSDKARALLAYLALEPREHGRAELAALLWPEIGDQYARANLRNTLYRLRQTLNSAATDVDDPLLTASRQTVRFNSAAADVDVLRFQALVENRHVEAAPDRLAQLEETVGLYRGELLAGFAVADAPPFEEWLLLRRELLHQRALMAFAILASGYERARNAERAYAAACRLLVLDAYREETYRQIMRLLVQMGEPEQALQYFEQMRQRFHQELGVVPSAETLNLVKQIGTGGLEKDSSLRFTTVKLVDEPSSTKAELGGKDQKARIDLSEIPIPGPFFGRDSECNRIMEWLVRDRCSVVAILGIGGMGKTSLAAQCVRTLASDAEAAPFELVLWRSLLNAPPLTELLPPLLHRLSNQQLGELPERVDEQLRLLLGYLREQRVLLVLDNMESILEAEQVGTFRAGYEPYAQLIQQMATLEHQSHLLLTSRERPHGYERMERDRYSIQSLQLTGLDDEAGRQLLLQRGVLEASNIAALLVERYSGNPLALKLVADTIEDLFYGDIDGFLREEVLFFDDIGVVLDQHFARLTELEQQILFWLAVEREPMPLLTLRTNLLNPPPQRRLVESIRNLRRRSLVERQRDGFGLQNVVTEYLTDRLVETAVSEVTDGKLDMLHRQPLIVAQAKEYVRESQTRLIMQPVAEQTVAHLGRDDLTLRLQQLLDLVRNQGVRAPSYAGGNLLNLFVYLRSPEWRGERVLLTPANYDFSRLALWQAHLRGRTLPAINLTECDLTNTAFTQDLGLVTSVAISRNGQLLAAGGSDTDISIWQLSDFQLLMTLPGRTRNVSAIAFNPDGTLLACATMHGTVCVWNLQSGQLLWFAEVSKAALYSVAFSPDGRFLVGSGHDPIIHFWYSQSGVRYWRLSAVAYGGTFTVSFHPHRPLLAGVNSEGCIHLWDIAHLITHTTDSFDANTKSLAIDTTVKNEHGELDDGAVVPDRVVRPPTADQYTQITAFAFSSDGLLFASGDTDGLINLWEVHSLTHVRTLRGHLTEIKDVEFSPDGKTLVSGSLDQTLRLWDVQRGACDALFAGDGPFWSASFTPDGQRLVSGGEQGLIRLWGVSPTRQIELLKILQGQLQVMPAAEFSPDGQWLVIGDSLGTIRLWDVTQLAPVCTHTLQGQDWVEAIAFHPDGQYFASAGGLDSYAIQLWDMSSKQCFACLSGHNQQVLVLAFSPDGSLLASAGYEGTVHLWDLSNPNDAYLRNVLLGHGQKVTDLTFNRSGTQLGSFSTDHTIRFWNTETGAEIHCITDPDSAEILQFSPSSDTLACWARGDSIRVVDMATLPDETDVTVLEGHQSTLKSVSFSPDGNLLVSGNLDQSIRLWDIEKGKQIYVLEDHKASVTKVRFSPDGQHFLSSSLDGTARLWEAETGECMHIFHAAGPYEGMNIAGVTGISEAQRAALKALGAVEG